jgi:hypothetical protein
MNGASAPADGAGDNDDEGSPAGIKGMVGS